MKLHCKLYKFFILYIFCGLIAFFLNASMAFSDQEWSGIRPPNCKCHSKNQKMVEMHKPFGVKDCLVCHQPSSMVMKGEGKEGKNSKMETARKKKKEDKVCRGCHSVKGATFQDAGGVGLWTKADAVTYFDDFKVTLPAK